MTRSERKDALVWLSRLSTAEWHVNPDNKTGNPAEAGRIIFEVFKSIKKVLGA